MDGNKRIIQNRKTTGEMTVIFMRILQDLLNELTGFTSQTGNSRSDVLQMCIRYVVDNIQIQEE